MGSFDQSVIMNQSKSLIFLTLLTIIAVVHANVKKLKKDVNKLKKKDTQIIKKLNNLGTDIDGVDDAIEQLKSKQSMLETLANELEKKDMAMEKTMKEIKDNGSDIDEKIKEIMNNA